MLDCAWSPTRHPARSASTAVVSTTRDGSAHAIKVPNASSLNRPSYLAGNLNGPGENHVPPARASTPSVRREVERVAVARTPHENGNNPAPVEQMPGYSLRAGCREPPLSPPPSPRRSG